MDLLYWRSAFSILIVFLAELFMVYYGQGQQIRVWPYLLSGFTMLHRILTQIFKPFNHRWLWVDVALSLAEAGAFTHQAFTIKWSIQDTILLYEFWVVVATIVSIFSYTFVSIWYWVKKASSQAKPIREGMYALGRYQIVAIVMFFIVSFSLTNVVVEPLRETNLLPMRATHSGGFPSNLWVDSCQDTKRYSCKPPTVLNVLVARPSISALGDDKKIEKFPAVRVAIFDDSKADPSAPSCDLVQQATRQVKGRLIDANITWNFLSFGCNYSGIQPQILITVNFTQLNANSDSSLDFPFLHVMMGNTNDTDEIIRMTETPAVILPGENIVGFAKQHVLQHLRSQIYATLGMGGVYDTIVMSEVLHLRPDPQSTKSPLIISSPDFATLRIIPFINSGDWKVIQEYRDKTALKGFASLGGLWSFFVGCTVWLFGTRFITDAFGTKPLTPFGKFHSILRFLGCPVPKTWKRYSSARDNKDPVAFVDFMVDYVVDLDYIQQQEAGDIEKNQSEKVAERSESLRAAASPSQ